MANVDLAKHLEHSKTSTVIRKYALPAILSGIVGALYNIIDQFFIGNYVGLAGNAATNVAFPLVTMQNALMLFLSIGGIANYSISMGRGDVKRAKKFIGILLLVTPIAGVILSCITLLFTENLLWLFGATQSNFELAFTYVRITAIGFAMYMTTESATKLIRADGSPKYAMICSMSGAVLNCFLNPLFMVGFKMGIAGAALATVVGQFVSLSMSIAYFFRFKSFKFKIKEIVPNFATMKTSASLGFASLSNQSVLLLGQVVMNNVFKTYGEMSIYGADIPLACVGIISKVTAIYFAAMIGIAQGAQPLLGFCYGAKKYDKIIDIYKLSAKYASIISVAVCLIFQLFPIQILKLFGAEDGLYIEFGVKYFRIFMLMTFLNGVQPITFNFFTAIGKPIRSVIVSLSKQLLFLIPIVTILPIFFGINGALFAGPIADLLAFIISMIFVSVEMKVLKEKSAKLKQEQETIINQGE